MIKPIRLLLMWVLFHPQLPRKFSAATATPNDLAAICRNWHTSIQRTWLAVRSRAFSASNSMFRWFVSSSFLRRCWRLRRAESLFFRRLSRYAFGNIETNLYILIYKLWNLYLVYFALNFSLLMHLTYFPQLSTPSRPIFPYNVFLLLRHWFWLLLLRCPWPFHCHSNCWTIAGNSERILHKIGELVMAGRIQLLMRMVRIVVGDGGMSCANWVLLIGCRKWWGRMGKGNWRRRWLMSRRTTNNVRWWRSGSGKIFVLEWMLGVNIHNLIHRLE